MKIDIPYYIRQVLREQRRVYVPGIGTFMLNQNASELTSDKRSISPPTLFVSFDEESSTDEGLSFYIVDSGFFTLKEINKAISKFSQKAIDDLVKTKSSSIKGLGLLKKSSDGAKVTFEANLAELTNEYKGLKRITLEPIQRLSDETVSHVVDSSDIKARAAETSPWWYPVLAGILLAALFLLWKEGCYDSKVRKDAPIEKVGALSEPNQNEVLKAKSDSVLDTKYKEVDEILDDDNNNQSNISEEIAKATEIIEAGNIDDEDLNSSLDNDSENEAILEKEGLVGAERYAEIIPASGRCIIILGSFKKAVNITKMISKIERTGKKVYTEDYQNNTRVGFTFDCDGVDIGTYLNEIRAEMSEKAWYLDPTIAIPYQ